MRSSSSILRRAFSGQLAAKKSIILWYSFTSVLEIDKFGEDVFSEETIEDDGFNYKEGCTIFSEQQKEKNVLKKAYLGRDTSFLAHNFILENEVRDRRLFQLQLNFGF